MSTLWSQSVEEWWKAGERTGSEITGVYPRLSRRAPFLGPLRIPNLYGEDGVPVPHGRARHAPWSGACL